MFLQVIVNVHGLTLVLLVPILPGGDQATKHLEEEAKHTGGGEHSLQGCQRAQRASKGRRVSGKRKWWSRST